MCVVCRVLLFSVHVTKSQATVSSKLWLHTNLYIGDTVVALSGASLCSCAAVVYGRLCWYDERIKRNVCECAWMWVSWRILCENVHFIHLTASSIYIYISSDCIASMWKIRKRRYCGYKCVIAGVSVRAVMCVSCVSCVSTCLHVFVFVDRLFHICVKMDSCSLVLLRAELVRHTKLPA